MISFFRSTLVSESSRHLWWLTPYALNPISPATLARFWGSETCRQAASKPLKGHSVSYLNLASAKAGKALQPVRSPGVQEPYLIPQGSAEQGRRQWKMLQPHTSEGQFCAVFYTIPQRVPRGNEHSSPKDITSSIMHILVLFLPCLLTHHF